jgi:hypothetical protein
VKEDILYGLVPIASLCDLLGIPAETTKMLIGLWSLVDSVEYWKKGATVDVLGMKGMDKKAIHELVRGESHV